MYQEDLFIESDFSCNKSSYSLREDSLLQIFKLLYKFFNPFFLIACHLMNNYRFTLINR